MPLATLSIYRYDGQRINPSSRSFSNTYRTSCEPVPLYRCIELRRRIDTTSRPRILSCSCRPLIFVLLNLMRGDNPLQCLLFQYHTEPVRAARFSVQDDRTITSRLPSVIPCRSCRGSKHSLRQLLVKFPCTFVGHWSCTAIPACIEFPPAFPLCFSEPLCEILSRRIAKRVTPQRRCESIRSLDRHRW